MVSENVSIRLPDSLRKMLGRMHPLGVSHAVKEILDTALVEEAFWKAKIEEYKSKIAYCEEMLRASPLFSGYTFTKEEHDYLKLHYVTAVKAKKPEILYENVYRGYNKITGLRLSLKQYQRVVNHWLALNKLEPPVMGV